MCARCRKPVIYPSTYCPMCQEQVDVEKEERQQFIKKKSDKKYNASRDPKYTRFYNSADWKILSAKVLQNNSYRCNRCKGIATQAHHKIEIKTQLGWDMRFDIDNIEPLCDKCHNKEHKRFGYD